MERGRKWLKTEGARDGDKWEGGSEEGERIRTEEWWKERWEAMVTGMVMG